MTCPRTMERRRPSARFAARACGFTLIELLVAIVVMSLLALLSWRAIDGMTRTQQITQARADGLLRLQAALGQWVADLDAAIDTGEVDALNFDGQVLRITRRDSAETGLDSRGLRVVAWTRRGESGQWMRWQSGPLLRRDELARAWQRAAEWGHGARPSQTGADSAIALAAIDQWQLFYHRGETWGHPQSSVGSEGATQAPLPGVGNLPNGVRLELTLSPQSTEGLSGSLVRDWVRPTLEAGRR